MVAYLLSHCGLGLSSAVIGAVVGTTDRAVRQGRQVDPKEFWKRLQQARRGHAPAKLQREQVGPVARFLADHPRCSVAELLDFIHRSFGVHMDRLTLRRFLKRYGLGCLRQQAVEDTPLLSDAPSTQAPSR
jgi:transposase